ncbi:Lipoprotein [Bordetella sputigena]
MCLAAALSWLAGCATRTSEPVPRGPDQVRAEVARRLPAGIADPAGWAGDIQVALDAQDIPATPANQCAVIAVIAQESSFRADPAVPGLPKIARAEINRRASGMHIPGLLVDAALGLTSPNGKTYSQRLDAVRTERDLSDIYEDFIGMVPMGRQLFGGLNPVHTAGPMQVSVDFAQAHAKGYPYSLDQGVRKEVFTRRGGAYFGTLHLLGYPAHYDAMIYRFADYNAGWYASRNAAFQNAVSRATGIPLALDGDVLRENSVEPGETERALRALRGRLDMSEDAIRRDLRAGDRQDFEKTMLYRRVFEIADKSAGAPLPRTVLPRITLQSPKITRQLTTAWFAERVNTRWKECMGRDG